MAERPRVSAAVARRLLMEAQGLAADPGRRATSAAIQRAIEKMGYVQIDTISVVERAHHHILFTRFAGYRPLLLDRLLTQHRKVFEHWTHDAAVLPTQVFPHWRRRFGAIRRELDARRYWARRQVERPEAVLAHVRERLLREGPCSSADFEHGGKPGGAWWAWKPAKAALEYLWWTGEISVERRVNFQKVYDLTERVLPADTLGAPVPSEEEHLDWCVSNALERLVVGTVAELTDFYRALPAAEAKRRLDRMCERGEAVPVLLESFAGDTAARGAARPTPGYAHPDWERRARRAPVPPDRMRLLSPFDPVIRDRKRVWRLFGFDYRFEAFVPAPKRVYGYYTLPILEGERFVGRLDPKLHRDRGELEIRGLWWEPGVTPTRARLRDLRAALALYAEQIGAERVRMPAGD